jgi:DnaA family protein
MQLTLPVHLPIDQQFDSFIVGDNQLLISRLKSMLAGTAKSIAPDKEPRQVFMHGGKGQGKSHLLYALCHYAERLGLQSFYLDLNQAKKMPTSLLEGFGQTTILCIDDVHTIASHRPWQIALFDLINQRMEQLSGLIFFTSNNPPGNQAFHNSDDWLPDLVSRLSWGETYAIKPLNDKNQISLLTYLADQKGMIFSEQTMSFIVNHCERNTLSLVNIIERLDKRSMIEKKPLSINLVKRELNL